MSPQIVPSDPDVRPNRSEDIEADARLREDIRLLGRILGDTVRDQEGADVFDLVERIRQTSIRFHRDDDKPARRELELILDSMSTSQTVRIVRAFSYFSHLANIAEDQNNIRQMRTRSTAGGTPRPGTLPLTLAHARAAGFSRGRPAQILLGSPDQPGADRAPHRSPPQEHDRPRDGDRSPAGPPRTGAIDAGRDRGQRRAAAPRGADAVADQSVAPDQAHRARRSRQRPVVLRLHLPARGAAAALRAGGPAERGRRRARRTGVVPADGKLDRRRSRRQPVRDRRGDARHARAAVEPGAALLSRGTARARLRAVDGGASGRRLQGSAQSRRTLARQVAASQRRALSPRGIGHLRAADRDRAEAGCRHYPAAGRRSRGLCRCRRSSRPISIFSIAR